MSDIKYQEILLSRMHDITIRYGEKLAIREHDLECSYKEFSDLIGYLSNQLNDLDLESYETIGLLLKRSALSYATMWACISVGRAFVSINPTYPHSRLRSIIDQGNIGSIVCTEDLKIQAEELGFKEHNIVLAVPPARLPTIIGDEIQWWIRTENKNIAYQIFTSGSTGTPKGVPISYSNLLAFINNMQRVIPYLESDNCSQVCELSFDVSIHEIFLSLLNGCTLHPARDIDLYNPASFIARWSITVWVSVPTLTKLVLNNGVPTDQKLKSIRLSIFNGESFTNSLARKWHSEIPHAEIWNTYGPAECTVAVTAQSWSPDIDRSEAGVVAIGVPFDDCEAGLLVDNEIVATRTAKENIKGELVLATPQRFKGYTDQSLSSPFESDNTGKSYYRTGDLALWRSNLLFYMGRVDHQVKINGHRIEILEVESRYRICLKSENIAVVASPQEHPTELVLFTLENEQCHAVDNQILGLPAYMIPKRRIAIESLPLNSNGKLDRIKLQQLAAK